MKTAIVIGATGLVGKHLTKLLLEDERYIAVKVFVRRPSSIFHSKLEEEIVDFNKLDEWKHRLTGDELFSSLGTTIKKAGSKEEQHKIDFTYQYRIAEAAAANGIENYFLVSSAGANASSKNFYLKIKGELEEEIEKLSFKKVIVLQPSLLLGEREETRRTETIASLLMPPLMALIPFFRKYKPIEGATVARALQNGANSFLPNRLIRYSLNEIFNLAQSSTT
jgi:uncharacterized protein YbjT (DUF2867 family)